MCRTGNQKEASDLAQRLVDGLSSPLDLSDRQWALLLLAADLSHQPRSLPMMVAHRVLSQLRDRRGFFANSQGYSLSQTQGRLAGSI